MTKEQKLKITLIVSVFVFPVVVFIISLVMEAVV